MRQTRRIAYTINEPDPPWSEIAQAQDWPADYARLLEEVGSILLSAAGYVRSPATTQGTGLATRQSLNIRLERAQQQLRARQTRLVHDAQQIEARAENAESPPSGASHRIAIRGAILTDLRRMLDEVGDIVEITAHPPLRGDIEG